MTEILGNPEGKSVGLATKEVLLPKLEEKHSSKGYSLLKFLAALDSISKQKFSESHFRYILKHCFSHPSPLVKKVFKKDKLVLEPEFHRSFK